MRMMTEDCLYLNIYTKNLIKRNNYDYEVDTKLYPDCKRVYNNLSSISGAALRRQQAVQCQPAS